MRENIKAEKWAPAIQDYKKGKMLFADTDIAVFEKVYLLFGTLTGPLKNLLCSFGCKLSG